MSKYNFNLEKDFKKYMIKQIIFHLSITFFFFVLFLFNFGIVMASFMLWVFLVLGVLILYVDIKNEYKYTNLKNEIENIKQIVGDLK